MTFHLKIYQTKASRLVSSSCLQAQESFQPYSAICVRHWMSVVIISNSCLFSVTQLFHFFFSTLKKQIISQDSFSLDIVFVMRYRAQVNSCVPRSSGHDNPWFFSISLFRIYLKLGLILKCKKVQKPFLFCIMQELHVRSKHLVQRLLKGV